MGYSSSDHTERTSQQQHRSSFRARLKLSVTVLPAAAAAVSALAAASALAKNNNRRKYHNYRAITLVQIDILDIYTHTYLVLTYISCVRT